MKKENYNTSRAAFKGGEGGSPPLGKTLAPLDF